MRIGARTSLTRPIGRDETPPARETARDLFEVAANRDGMQADDWKSIAAIVIGNRDSIDRESSTV